jgi:ATP-dependent protease ClpP protease subunit
MGRHEDLPTLTVVVNSSVETTLRPNGQYVVPRLTMWQPQRFGVQHLSKSVVDGVCDLAVVDKQCVRLSTLREQSRLRNAVRTRLDKTMRAVSVDEQEAVNTLLEERMRIIFLLNTYGGCVDTSERLMQLAVRVRKNGGEVWAYGREKVNSSGAMIFMAADPSRRVVVKKTSLFFHLSTHARRHHTHARSNQLMESTRKYEVAELRTIFAQNSVHRDYARYLTRSIDSVDAKTPLGEDTSWTISDLEAEQFWHVKRRSLPRAKASYLANMGGEKKALELLQLPQAKAVRKFFL